MSDETKAALDQAIANHISDEAGAITTGYVLFASYFSAELDEEEAVGYYADYTDRQPYHVGIGLAHTLVHYLEQEANWGSE